MIGIVLVTHGKLALEMQAVAEHVVGKQPYMQCVCIDPEDDMEQRRQEIIDASEKVAGSEGTIILTDMFGGTPSNLAIASMVGRKIEVIAGVNLPMLIKILSIRHNGTLANVALAGQEAGRKYINVASNLLKKTG